MKNLKLILSKLLFIELITLITALDCPNGFMVYNNVCVEVAKDCPQNFLWQAGVCVPNAPITSTATVVNTQGEINKGCCPCPCPKLPCTAAQPCTNVQPCTAMTSCVPCSNCATTTPCQVNQPCTNNPLVTPCQANQPCLSNPPVTPCQVNQPCMNNPLATPCQVNQPCQSNPPVVPCPATCPPPVLPPPVTVSPQTPPPPTQPDVTTPPPGALTVCPPGTVEIDGVCRLIGCGKWFIYIGGKCVKVRCPSGTYWSGDECVEAEPKEFNISFNNTITTQINHTEPAIIIDNVNNLNVTVVNTPKQSDCNNDYCEDDEVPEVTYDDTTSESNSEPTETNCCRVITPRVCKPKLDGDQKHWACYSRRYKRCGSFCVAPTIYLKAPEAVERPGEMVLPPIGTGLMPQTNIYPGMGSYDCSGCVSGRPELCASYCHRTVCPPPRCSFYDQRQYCLEYPGENGCQERDGCYSDWCSGGYVM